MILVELEIENYKQFTGLHHFRPTSEGVIFVSGLNGAGKTTLFEAIEWCLYNPSRIKNSDVGPHHAGGIPRVKVVLEDPATGRQIAIERQLKGATTKVVAYSQDDSTITIADGARAVAKYVQQTLVGLDHRAFEATIFTRQKELGFFSTVSDPERRIQVGKLLGLEAIRAAEVDLRAQAKAAADLARLTRQNLQQVVGDRNLEEALRAAIVQETSLSVVVTEAGNQLAAIRAVQATQIEKLNLLLQKQNRQRELDQQIGNQRALLALAAQRAEHADQRIASIDQRQQERSELATIAGTIPALQKSVADHVAAHQLQQQAEAAQRTIEDRAEKLSQLEHQVANFVEGRVTPAVRAWRWIGIGGPASIHQLKSLLVVASNLDVTTSATRIEQMEHASRTAQQRHTAAAELDRYKGTLDALRLEHSQLTTATSIKETSPDPRQAATDSERTISESNTQIRGLREQRQRATNVIDNLKAEQFEEGCPTCGRPFTPDQRDDANALFQRDVSRIDKEITELEGLIARSSEQLQHAREQIAAMEAKQESIRTLAQRIENGEELVAEKQEGVTELDARLAAELEHLQMATPPDEASIAAVRDQLDSFRRISMSVDYLATSTTQLENLAAEHEAAKAELSVLTDTHYDRDAHQQSEQALAKAQEAAGKLAEIDRQIASKPGLETERTNAGAAIATATATVERLQGELLTIGFDPAALTAAEQSVNESRSTELAAVVRERDAIKDQAIAELVRVAAERDLAWAGEQEAAVVSLERESEELDSMTKAMSRFDRYVARRVTPELAAITSELLHEVTDGKYSEVEFDENYGIKVHDENGEAFPLSTYSGGERDVVALCARLALSQYIGSQSASPPRFVVLDEIFGSLDDGRRNNVIAMLNALVSQTGVFSQMFVISHVGEMTTAGNIDQHWTVQENQSGFSTLSLDGAITESTAQLTLV